MQTNPFKFGLNKQTLMITGSSIALIIMCLSMIFTNQDSFTLGFFWGLLGAMGFVNFFIYLFTQSFRFLIYSVFILFLSFALAAFYGVGDKYIWPEIKWLKQHSLDMFIHLSLCLSLLFSYFLLNVSRYSRVLSLLLKAASAIVVIFLVLGLFIAEGSITTNLVSVLIIGSAIILTSGVWLGSRGVALAKSYTLAWSALLLSICLLSLEHLAPIGIPDSILLLGAVIKTSLLTATLVFNYHQERQSSLITKIETLEDQKKALQIQSDVSGDKEHNTHDLEYKVQERTLELEIALRELSEKNNELEERNTLDALTGIRNRNYFDKKYQAELRRSRREQTHLSIVMLDIDHFKKVNDQHGHLVGDECIKTVAHIIQQSLKRPSDDVCRYGGEEFALILPSTELAGALNLVEQIRIKISETVIKSESIEIQVTVSAGVATAIAELSQAEDTILALADKQLYKAKNAGRNKVLGSDLNAS